MSIVTSENEEASEKNDEQFEEIDNNEMKEKQPKKGFWSRLFGN